MSRLHINQTTIKPQEITGEPPQASFGVQVRLLARRNTPDSHAFQSRENPVQEKVRDFSTNGFAGDGIFSNFQPPG